MSYFRSLDEYEVSELLEELARRKRLQDKGLCDYCEREAKESSCKFPGRHYASVRKGSE